MELHKLHILFDVLRDILKIFFALTGLELNVLDENSNPLTDLQVLVQVNQEAQQVLTQHTLLVNSQQEDLQHRQQMLNTYIKCT